MTEKLYYKNSYTKSFVAKILSCTPTEIGFAVCLDKTAFFPEGGGQPADTGKIGDAKVFDVQIINDKIIHYTHSPLIVGDTLSCCIDWQQRFKRMQNHSGEHILSGILHSKFGCDNVGFHMGEDAVTIDFNIELSPEDIESAEIAANKAVYENVAIRTIFPPANELKNFEYRSKLELASDVRLVIIEGYDVCACCAPHVSYTGEIGIIKVTSMMRHRGGTRLTMLCGTDAYCDYTAKSQSNTKISSLLSSKPHETVEAVTKLLDKVQSLKNENYNLTNKLAALYFQNAKEDRKGNICVFCPPLENDSIRKFINRLTERCSGICAAFSGDDVSGYRYIIASRSTDIRDFVSEMNTALRGRGGGSYKMVQGALNASRNSIEAYFDK